MMKFLNYVPLGISKNISTIIWKDNFLENYLKRLILRDFVLKSVYGPSAEECSFFIPLGEVNWNMWKNIMVSPSSRAIHIVKDVNLEGKTCLVTGASGSIGGELTRCLSSRGCSVLMACRNVYKASQIASLCSEQSDRISCYNVNLASLASVKKCADQILENEKKIDIVILNAATFGLPWTLTEDKLETTFQVNFLSQYYLLILLEKILSHDARVVFTSTESHRNINWTTENMLMPILENLSLPKQEYTSIKSYNISKFCGILAMHYLSNQWSQTQRSVFCAHPGSFIKTGLCRNWWLYEMLYILMIPFSKSVVQGASSVVYCATSPELNGVTAAYIKNCKPCDESDLAKNYIISYRIHDVILETLRERVTDFDKILCS